MCKRKTDRYEEKKFFLFRQEHTFNSYTYDKNFVQL